ncbi:SDR family NAD(P)-dependent oxidoreductase [Agarivorans aestuarii]|uniref:SDR family NAD(P)-dependent oxidoreductase n=1 Tax=Agarivorans aestuarii TaxID=1563703 RepID=UPI003AF3A3A8
MASKPWSAEGIPTQKGRVSVVTASTSGIGKETARVLAQKQSKVVLAVRNVSKGEKSQRKFEQKCLEKRVQRC